MTSCAVWSARHSTVIALVRNRVCKVGCLIAFEVGVVVQEADTYSPAVRPQRRRQMQQEVVAAAPHALQVLASCLNQGGIGNNLHS